MVKIHTVIDPETCQSLWESLWPKECLFDLWPVRNAFRLHYPHRPQFLVAEESGKAAGLLALSWIEEKQYYGHFPGELWQGKTWLEQNKIPAADPAVAEALLAHVPGAMHLRYLRRDALPESQAEAPVDETGYLFMPPQYDYSYEKYLEGFSGKSRKKLRREFAPLEAQGISYRLNCIADVKTLFQLNLLSFGDRSYFHDTRFLNAFESLVAWLEAQGMLRVTTVLIGGRVAAVDIGAVWNSAYTVLAGGTDPDFPGVAKLINFQHLEWACRERFEVVDFLCGDFGWKERFHLTPRPLYKLETSSALIRKGHQDAAHAAHAL
jgi:hypothetical protein